MTVRRAADQSGFTVFEAMIIILILLLIGFSCYAVSHKINEQQKHANDSVKQITH